MFMYFLHILGQTFVFAVIAIAPCWLFVFLSLRVYDGLRRKYDWDPQRNNDLAVTYVGLVPGLCVAVSLIITYIKWQGWMS